MYVFGKNLKNLRISKNITQTRLGEMLDLASDRKSISNYEKGRSYPPIDKLIKISNIFGVTIDELLKEEIGSHINEVTLDLSAFNSTLLENYSKVRDKGVKFEKRKAYLSNIITQRAVIDVAGDDFYAEYIEDHPGHYGDITELKQTIIHTYPRDYKNSNIIYTDLILPINVCDLLIRELGFEIDQFKSEGSLRITLTNEFLAALKLINSNHDSYVETRSIAIDIPYADSIMKNFRILTKSIRSEIIRKKHYEKCKGKITEEDMEMFEYDGYNPVILNSILESNLKQNTYNELKETIYDKYEDYEKSIYTEIRNLNIQLCSELMNECTPDFIRINLTGGEEMLIFGQNEPYSRIHDESDVSLINFLVANNLNKSILDKMFAKYLNKAYEKYKIELSDAELKEVIDYLYYNNSFYEFGESKVEEWIQTKYIDAVRTRWADFTKYNYDLNFFEILRDFVTAAIIEKDS
ncbi:helix-turn-helix transcriptional regulator [Mycoplasmatota bacterium zrk1]